MMKLPVVALLLIAMFVMAAAAPTKASDYNRVKTANGYVEGSTDLVTGIHEFRGIPYAQPPVGDLMAWASLASAGLAFNLGGGMASHTPIPDGVSPIIHHYSVVVFVHTVALATAMFRWELQTSILQPPAPTANV